MEEQGIEGRIRDFDKGCGREEGASGTASRRQGENGGKIKVFLLLFISEDLWTCFVTFIFFLFISSCSEKDCSKWIFYIRYLEKNVEKYVHNSKM